MSKIKKFQTLASCQVKFTSNFQKLFLPTLRFQHQCFEVLTEHLEEWMQLGYFCLVKVGGFGGQITAKFTSLHVPSCHPRIQSRKLNYGTMQNHIDYQIVQQLGIPVKLLTIPLSVCFIMSRNHHEHLKFLSCCSVLTYNLWFPLARQNNPHISWNARCSKSWILFCPCLQSAVPPACGDPETVEPNSSDLSLVRKGISRKRLCHSHFKWVLFFFFWGGFRKKKRLRDLA